MRRLYALREKEEKMSHKRKKIRREANHDDDDNDDEEIEREGNVTNMNVYTHCVSDYFTITFCNQKAIIKFV